MSDETKKRASDKSWISLWVEWKWTKFFQQLSMLAAIPFLLWGVPKVIERYTFALDQNTFAINHLIEVVDSNNAEFREKLLDHDHRINRLENVADGSLLRRR